MLSLFSGIGAFEKALERQNIPYELVGFSEIDKYAIESYCAIHNVSEDLNLGDVSQLCETEVPECDLVTYGFPCQDISVAGQQKGILEGETRSGLLYEALRIIRYKKPKYAIAENVKNLIGKKFKKDFEVLLDELDGYGYNNYWKVLNAKDHGVPQNRERVFIISIRKDVDDGSFRFPLGKSGELKLKDFLLDCVEEKYYIDNERVDKLLDSLQAQQGLIVSDYGKKIERATDTASCLMARDYKGFGRQSMTAIAEPTIVASRGREDSSRKTNATKQKLEVNKKGTTNTLTTVQKDNLVLEPKRLGGLYDSTEKRRQAGAVWDKSYIAPTIDTCQGGHREPLIIDDAQGFDGTRFYEDGYTPTLRSQRSGLKTISGARIRKLTPLECWRLMGFDDEDYWKARKALEQKFYNGGDRSNSQMYKMAGNSIVVNVLEGIFENLLKGEYHG